MGRKSKARRRQDVAPERMFERSRGRPSNSVVSRSDRVPVVSGVVWDDPVLKSPLKNRAVRAASPNTSHERNRIVYDPRSSPRKPLRLAQPSIAALRDRISNQQTEKTRSRSALSLKASALKSEPAKQSSPNEGARETNTCKARPDSKIAARAAKGAGKKKFVPWC